MTPAPRCPCTGFLAAMPDGRMRPVIIEINPACQVHGEAAE